MTKKGEPEAVVGETYIDEGTLNFWVLCAIFNILLIASMVVKINNLQDEVRVLEIELSHKQVVQYCVSDSDLYKPNSYSF